MEDTHTQREITMTIEKQMHEWLMISPRERHAAVISFRAVNEPAGFGSNGDAGALSNRKALNILRKHPELFEEVRKACFKAI
jgi:hypothetical protein